MSIAAAKLTCYELVKSRNGSYPSLMAAAVNVLILVIYAIMNFNPKSKHRHENYDQTMSMIKVLLKEKSILVAHSRSKMERVACNNNIIIIEYAVLRMRD